MMSARISVENKHLAGTITLPGSKSISNRVLMIRALCSEHFQIENLSQSDDTTRLSALLDSSDTTLDTHHAGTTYRFLAAYLAIQQGEHILTGSAQMKKRPVKPLVDALRQLGANISYLEQEGFPPLLIRSPNEQLQHEVSLPADVSSQFITALLLIAPVLPDGLSLHLNGAIVSRPYIEMTLAIQSFFGIKHRWEGNNIIIAPQKYEPNHFKVEADWSAASYYYVMAGLSKTATIRLNGLYAASLQGDAAISQVAMKLGIHTSFVDDGIVISKSADIPIPPFLELNFIQTPDLFQSIACLCAGLGINGLFTGLQTLKIKETDRIAALQNELSKVGVFLTEMPSKFSKKSGTTYFMQEGRATSPDVSPDFETYEDHRMALSLAPLALCFPIIIKHPEVVSKSYPNFWQDIQLLGLNVQFIPTDN